MFYRSIFLFLFLHCCNIVQAFVFAYRDFISIWYIQTAKKGSFQKNSKFQFNLLILGCFNLLDKLIRQSNKTLPIEPGPRNFRVGIFQDKLGAPP